ncbi:DUF3373 domain-containing protein [Shewanella oneidensis MR-1]|uniref:DUF3373 domain-containing protein n=1 Tax=Shewanella oneidensis (strain ATCC 700550 / JCM 31522 / CIP 106686 / LMG 19005 / NCIMB 14063 / MR-1) TaxID=211586 RepID=Q8E9W9_SHEON|nr:DUF3373 domain-containing protein [Shewanella oneidensis]AAN57116.1 outer membrane protein of unknown function DUF3373 [Shewanella oneidensis MR-1]MDX5998558.1 DUF3373 domain-containing protein [Shewanella oneidensis]MEE2028404.1 hypothetical protein [Shewanella oneidensis]QKG98389.1 DUF3373 domain-containing protein [Shewanella oneidensis MR-1]
MRTLISILVANALFMSGQAFAAANNTQADTQKMAELKQQLTDITEQLDELNSRVDKTERHTSLDRLEITGDFRTKAHSLHYRDVVWNPAINVNFNDFGAKAMSGVFGMPNDPNSPLGKMMQANPDLAAAFQNGMLQGVMPYVLAPKSVQDIDNDIFYTTRLRLNLKAKVWDNVSFAGRLSMYKNWGDSTGVQVFDSWRSFTMDGTSSGNTSGDWLRVERAYFDWKNINGSEFYLSIGRRPSTYGPPSHYRENELRGGTPSGHLVNFNFDGATLGYNLGELTGIEGQIVRFCYGQGFESQWGNGEMFGDIVTKDTHLGGFNIDAINDGTNFLQFTLFGAKDVNDGFKGTMAFPTQLAGIFAPTMYQDMQKFDNFNFVTRVQPSGVIGDMYLGGIGFAREEANDIKWFASLGWTRAEPNGNAGMFGGMLSDAVFEAELNSTGTEIIMVPKTSDDTDTKDGYGIYVGIQIPAPYGKFGLEYNYGSEYWTPFTQAQDDPIGSKLATRGHVGEAYYIFDINPKMFIKLAGLYYDYEYTGSGTPVGAPQKIDDVLAGSAYSMLPVVDKAFDVNASLTINF